MLYLFRNKFIRPLIMQSCNFFGKYEMLKYDHDTVTPLECRRQRTLNSIHEHTAARLQSNGNLAV